MEKIGRVSIKDVEPGFAYILDDDTKGNYGDDSFCGRGTLFFIKDGSDVTKEEFEAWVKKVFEATAKVSDDGYNIEGYGFGNGEVEKQLEAVLTGFINTWSYKYNGTILDVYVETKYSSFNTGEKVYGNEYSKDIAVKVEIGVGMQKSWDETVEDVEKAFEENGDEIEKTLEDALK